MSHDFRYRGEVFNIGGSGKFTISLLELFDVPEQISGKGSKSNTGHGGNSTQKVYVSDITKAFKLLQN